MKQGHIAGTVERAIYDRPAVDLREPRLGTAQK
jgi:hypothetical protein